MKFGQWKKKDRWLFLLTLGVILCILAFPAERFWGTGGGTKAAADPRAAGEGTGAAAENAAGTGETFSQEAAYEKAMEARVRELLSHVEGVGAVEVMIVLKSSSEKIWQTDENSSSSVTEELQEQGASRKQSNTDSEIQTVRLNAGKEEAAMLKKELYPEISGIVISADGGGNPGVQWEISLAMEALFGLPAHKIKVLKRVE